MLYEVARRSGRPTEPARKRRPFWQRADVASESRRHSPPAAVHSSSSAEVAPSYANDLDRPSVQPGAAPSAWARALQFELREGRARVTIAWPAAVVVGAGLVITLAITFEVGRRVGQSGGLISGAAPTVGSTDETFRDALDPSLDAPRPGPSAAVPPRSAGTATDSADAGIRPSPGPAAQPAAVQFQKGMHHLVIQHFRKSDLPAAQDAQAYLRAAGVECVLDVRGEIRLIAAEPFDISNKAAAVRQREQQRGEQLRQKVKQAGKQYAREHGYAFEQCYLREF